MQIVISSVPGFCRFFFGRPSIYLQQLGRVFDYLIALKNVRELGPYLFATQYVRDSFASAARYFVLTSKRRYVPSTKNPWDLITFIAFFPPLEGVTTDTSGARTLPILPESELREFGPDSLATSRVFAFPSFRLRVQPSTHSVSTQLPIACYIWYRLYLVSSWIEMLVNVAHPDRSQISAAPQENSTPTGHLRSVSEESCGGVAPNRLIELRTEID
jgi:hypothetical protein